jgi:hypothetical protein
VQAATEGIDAVGRVTIRIQADEPVNGLERTIYSGHGADTDIVVASAKAYTFALNRLIAARREAQGWNSAECHESTWCSQSRTERRSRRMESTEAGQEKKARTRALRVLANSGAGEERFAEPRGWSVKWDGTSFPDDAEVAEAGASPKPQDAY